MKHQPRGIRNNNPGNIERNSQIWKGASSNQSADPRFIVFNSARWGIRALAKLLLNYQKIHSLNTISKIITRWAPSNENNTNAYIAEVAKFCKFGKDEKLDLSKYETLSLLVRAIIKHENGPGPNSGEWYLESEIKKALALIEIYPGEK